jgi:hypothetical protein
VGVLKSLEGATLVTMVPKANSAWELTADGERYTLPLASLFFRYIVGLPVPTHSNPHSHMHRYVKEGTPEFQVWSALGKGPQTQEALEAAVGKDSAKLGWSQCLKLKWASLDKETKTLVRASEGITDESVRHLKTIIVSPVDDVSFPTRSCI